MIVCCYYHCDAAENNKVSHARTHTHTHAHARARAISRTRANTLSLTHTTQRHMNLALEDVTEHYVTTEMAPGVARSDFSLPEYAHLSKR